MQHYMRLINFACALTATILFVGCTDMSQPDELSGTKEQADGNIANQSHLEDDAEADYVSLRANLKTINENFAWFENDDSGHDDGIALMASFQIKEPSSNIDRIVNILFKYDAKDDIPGPPSVDDLGKLFEFELPRHTVTEGNFSVDNLTVRNLRKSRP